MRVSRRRFMQIAAMAGGATLLPMPVRWLGCKNAFAFYQSPTTIPLFGTTLRGVGPGQIPVADVDTFTAPVTGVSHYTIDIGQFQDSGVVPGLGPTTLWGFNPAKALGLAGAQTAAHLGGIIVAQRGQPIQITFRNRLTSTGLPAGTALKNIIPVDTTIPGANQAQNRIAVHLHGGFVPWISDGGPFDWFGPDGTHGLSFLNNQVLNPSAGLNEAEYYYPNDQSARMMWYHDHAWGITRINAYAGVASAYLIRDAFEIHLKNLGLPEFIENSVLGNTTILELPIIVQDKIFVGNNILTLDPTWPGPTSPGSLWYPHIYERNRWKLQGTAKILPDPSVIPEMFGDTMLVNGTAFPTATVEARRYRLRVLNACNARFLNLQLYVGDTSANGITLNAATGIPTNAPFVDGAQGTSNVLMIGSEGGFLPKPVLVPTNLPFNPVTLGGSLVMGPAERSDIIIDFSNYAGKSVILFNDAPAPFPIGDPRNDYFPGFNVKGNPVNALTPAGFGPNTRVLMKFNVTAATGADAPLQITTATDFATEAANNGLVWNDPLLVPVGVTTPPPGVMVRQLTLNETFDVSGRLIQLLGTNVPLVKGTFGRAYTDTATETPQAGVTEIWQIANLTGDTHPIHFHLINTQIISRQPIKVTSYSGIPSFTGPARGPDPNETGWKETVRMNPGELTTVIMQFRLPANPPNVASIPTSPRTGGHEYVWHCHILEHEEHDMMRPLVVL